MSIAEILGNHLDINKEYICTEIPGDDFGLLRNLILYFYDTTMCLFVFPLRFFFPLAKGKILQIEKVHRRAARWTSNNFDPRSRVTAMLDDLGWRTLEQRRADARLCLFYKIVYELVAIPMPDYIEPNPRVSRYCHSMTFRQVQTFINFYYYCFFRWALSRGMPYLLANP